MTGVVAEKFPNALLLIEKQAQSVWQMPHWYSVTN